VYCAQSDIDRFLKQKAEWIARKSKEQKNRFERLSQKKYVNGQEFFFLGRKYPLKIVNGPARKIQVNFDGKELIAEIPEEKHTIKIGLKKRMIDWYKEQAQELLAARIFHYARIT